MGLLVNGVWQDQWYDTEQTGGHFVRPQAVFRNWVTGGGRLSSPGAGGFSAEPHRYHLYVSLACPWAHRTLLFRKLKKLEQVISVSVVDPFMGNHGWAFRALDGSLTPGSTPDEVNHARYLHEIYTKAKPDFTGRVTVPVLWDKKTAAIVNNESAEIIRMLNSAFDAWGDACVDFYPPHLRGEIDRLNAYVYENVNNGVYKCGFATTQAAYEAAFDALFDALDRLEERLSAHRYLAGGCLTEADWRLFTTLARFDAVYHGHFKCNLRRIADYPNLSNYLRELYHVPGVAETVNLFQIKRHYYASHAHINPTRIVPKGPALDFGAPHDRDRLPKEEPRSSVARARSV
jgi:putative glutathione S-transferase